MSSTKRGTPPPDRSVRSLRRRLEEAEETIRAIRDGEVDAFVMRAAELEEVVPLEAASRPYRMLVERMHQAALTLGSDEGVLYCNQRFGELVGRRMAEVYSNAFPAFLHPFSRSTWHALRRQAIETGHSESELILAGAGGPIPVLASVAPFGRGAAVGLSVMLTDLTVQKRHEQVVAAEALSRSILEQAADAIVVCDENLRIIRTSRAALRLCGRNPVLLPFDAAFALWQEVDGQPRFVRLASVLGQAPAPQEVRLRRESGEVADLLFRASPLEQDGRTIGCVVTLTDIGERKRTEQALREADRRKDEFLAVLGHELRNALGPIRNSTRLLERLENEGRSGSGARRIIERQVAHMVRIVDDLLDIARIAQGEITLSPEPVDAAELVRSAAEDHRGAFAAAEIELDVHLPREPLPIFADPTRVTQALGNVLHNALKFTGAGGRVTVSAAGEEGNAVLRVRDTGIGMDEEVLGRVFDHFNQSRAARQRSRGGLGLGMAIAREIVRLHDGALEASSEGPGRGSEFTIRLPLDDRAETTERRLPPAETVDALRRILVVEDNADMAESLKLLLEMSGHDVRHAANGLDGVAVAAAFRPDLVLCDLGLPGEMDGFAVAARLRRDPATASAHLIALSGYAGGEDQRRAIEAGFDLHVAKPVSFERLEEVFATLAKTRRPADGAGEPG